MALQIVALCINCWAYQPLCTTQATYQAKAHFEINASKCTECAGDYPDYQGASICPVEGAIVNSLGQPVNPPGSLTEIPWAKITIAAAVQVIPGIGNAALIHSNQ